jgi:hypothetical protein
MLPKKEKRKAIIWSHYGRKCPVMKYVLWNIMN